MGELIEQWFPTINIFIELEEMMGTIFMVMYKNEKKQKHNGLNYPN